ncbi:MAG: T4 RnlA family RNA ligase [Thermoguttaceae bacterium]
MSKTLHTQEYLQSHDYDDLLSEFGIEHRRSKDLPMVILNYNMYLIPTGKKGHPIVRECRGLTLDSRDNSLVAKSFDRFFNYGEMKDDPFDFGDFSVQAKEDGSLIKIFYFENRWHIHTRFSFGDGACCDAGESWESIVLQTLKLNSTSDLDKFLKRNLTYICELCTLANRVVREYTEPHLFLLSIFEGAREFSLDECDQENTIFERPKVYKFAGIDEILQFLDQTEANDPSFEGFVLRDGANNRLKVKSKSYLKLSYYFGNRTAFHPRQLIVLVHDGDTDEILTYYPNVRPDYEKVKETVEKHLEKLWTLYCENANKGKRGFHESVVGTPLYVVIERLYKQFGNAATREDLFQLWRQNEDKVLGELFGVSGTEHNLRHKPNYEAIRKQNQQSRATTSQVQQ